MKLALMLPAIPSEKWAVARQIGVRYAITKLAPELTGSLPPWDFDSLLQAKTRFEDAGFVLYGLEGDEFDMQRIKQGKQGRDEDIEKYSAMLTNMGILGIRLICVNFMAQIGWMRTSRTTPERGGARTTSFDADLVSNAPLTEAGIIRDEQMWDNLTYFIEAVMPAAEKAGVRIALHPDDPPVSPLRGVARILSSARGFRRALGICKSPHLGVAFCQANFRLMGEDVRALVREFGGEEKIFYVHFRDVEGTRERFHETFHDNGPTDMAEMLKLYHDVGFDGPIRPDHTPEMEGEGGFSFEAGTMSAGYEMKGRLFAVGYMRGIMDALHIPVE